MDLQSCYKQVQPPLDTRGWLRLLPPRTPRPPHPAWVGAAGSSRFHSAGCHNSREQCVPRARHCSKHFASTLTNVRLAAASRIPTVINPGGLGGEWPNQATRPGRPAPRLAGCLQGCPAVPLDAIPTLFLCQEEGDPCVQSCSAQRPCPQAAFPRWAVEQPGEIKGREEREVCVNSPDALPARSPRLAVTLEGRSQPLSCSPLHRFSP